MNKPNTVEEYIAAQPEAVRTLLEDVRSAIRRAVPEAEESISYKLPTYKLNGRPLLYFAAWTHHYSLYPATSDLVATFGAELRQYEINKGTIRFPLSGAVPAELIERIAKFRARELVERRNQHASSGTRARSRRPPS